MSTKHFAGRTGDDVGAVPETSRSHVKYVEAQRSLRGEPGLPGTVCPARDPMSDLRGTSRSITLAPDCACVREREIARE